jgi:E3 SUMO-protein ligase RanBP2
MSTDRIQVMEQLVARNPDDPRARFGLALELEKAERWGEAAEQFRAYLARADDEGNAWGRLGGALRQLGDQAGAREAYRMGAEAAYRHGHPSMAAEFEEILSDWQ